MHIVARMPSSPSVTMEAVARAARVSRSTVSRALRNDPRLTPATRERVRRIADEMGYRPNPLVATLMADLKGKRPSSATSTLAFVTAYPSRDGWRRQNPSFLDYFDGARERAALQGYVLEPFWLREPGMTAERFSRMLHTRHIGGVLIPPLPRPLGHLSLEWMHFTAIAIGYTLQRPELSRAVTNFYQSMRLTLRRLNRMGCERIGFATDAGRHERVQHAWLGAYLLFQQTLPARRRLPAFTCPDSSGTGMDQWLRVSRPDAVIGASNAVFAWLQRAGVAVPGDMVFASLNTGRNSSDPAGIDQQSRLVGATAIDLLIGQIHRNEQGLPLHPMLTLIPGIWADGPTVLD